MNFSEIKIYINNHINNPKDYPMSTVFKFIDHDLQFSCITLHDGVIGHEFEDYIRNSSLTENEKKKALDNPEHYLKSPLGSWKNFQVTKNNFPPKSKTRIGIVTGKISNLLILDVDDVITFNKYLLNNNIITLPDTLTVKTGKGGFHYYFLYPNNGMNYNCTTDKENGFDTRGEGGYVLSFGSLHPNGNYYTIENPAPISQAPEWLLEYIHTRNNMKKSNNNSFNTYPKEITNSDVNLVNNVDLSYLEEEVQNLVKNGCAVGHRSEAIGKILFHAISNGYSQEEIKEICFNKSFGISQKFIEEGSEFFKREYDSALDNIKKLGVKIKSKTAKNKNKFDPGTAVINIMNSFEYLISEDEKIYAVVNESIDNKLYLDIDSREFASYIYQEYRSVYSKTLSPLVLKSSIEELLITAKQKAQPADSICRFLQYEDKLVYYTGVKNNFIVIDDNGYKCENNLKIIIKKSKFITQVSDIKFNMSGVEYLNKFFDILDISSEFYRDTITLSLISYLFNDISTPILYFYGDGGSSKTSLLTYIKSILDPFEPLDITENTDLLAKFFDKIGIAHFDNFSGLSSRTQDKFCKAYSGGTASFIKKYTDDDILNYKFKCPLMLSAVKVPLNMKDDFYSRVTFMKFHKHRIIKTDYELKNELDKLYPYVRGEIFALASEVFKLYTKFTPTNLTRHASFETLGKAYFKVIGKTEEDYINFTKQKIANDAYVYVSSDPVILAFINIILKDNFKFFTMSEIVNEIDDVLDDDYLDLNVPAIGKRIVNLKEQFEKIGIKLFPGKKSNKLQSRPYLAVTSSYLNQHPDFDSSILNIKENINHFYDDYKKSLEVAAVDNAVDSMLNQ